MAVDDETRTRRLWNGQNRHEGYRQRLFTAVAAAIPVNRVLYPGSFVDIAPSFMFDDVTYVDIDRRAARFFEDAETVDAIIAEHRSDEAHWSFDAADYRDDLGLGDDSFDLLVSLYAGPVSDACGHLIPKRPAHPSREEILSHGRGIAYTRSPFAYLFQRTG
jgi:hypothetical protein